LVDHQEKIAKRNIPKRGAVVRSHQNWMERNPTTCDLPRESFLAKCQACMTLDVA
jgi:hypothetical protein